MEPVIWKLNRGERGGGSFPRRSSRFLTFSFLFAAMACCALSGDDFSARFQLLPGTGDTASFDPHRLVVRHGRRMDAMVLVAPAAVRAPLTGLSGSLRLECYATPVFNIGDGIQLDIAVRNGSGERNIYSRYFDAARRAEDRDWVPLAIPLDVEDSSSELIITVSGGPQGDLVADWLALAGLRIRQRTQAR